MIRLVAALSLLLVTTAVAEPPVELARIFPQEADVTVDGNGLARLVLPPAVLSACRPDLSDVRVFDAAGNEVPYVVDAGPPPGDARVEATVVDARVVHVERIQTPREDQPPRARETYRLAAPGGPGPWTLRIDTAQSGFVRRVDVSTANGPLIENVSIVRLGDASADRMHVPLPPFDAPELTVTIEGDEGWFLQPTFRFETARRLTEAPQVTVPLPIVTSSRVGTTTVLEVERPSGIVPGLLRVATSTPAFDRRVRVWDVLASGADVGVGDGRVRRVTAGDTLDAPDVELAPSRGDRLRIEIVDGDSPALADLRFEAVVRQPALIFALSGRHGTLRFGGGRAYRPRYDLTALVPPSPARGLDAEIATRLWDPARLATATLGPIRPNPRYDASPALAFAMRAGAAVDVARLAWRRPFTVPAAPNGLATLLLEPGDVARARPDLADLRVVDAEGRQWPFLLDRDVPPTRIGLFTEGPEQHDGRSHWTLRPHEAPLLLQRLELGIAAPFFHRRFRLLTTIDGAERVLAGGELVRDARRPRPTSIDVAPIAVSSMTLVVDDGDDAPLPLHRAWADMPTAALLVAAPPGEYVLLLGDPEATAPRYELAAVRDVVVALTAVPVTSQPLIPNPAFSRAARVASSNVPKQALVWTVLIGAVLVLGLLTLRAARMG